MKLNRRITMNTNARRITSCASARAAVAAREFIVGTFDANGYVSFSTNPVVHTSEAQAKAEAQRLARANPGKHYTWVRFHGAAVVADLQVI